MQNTILILGIACVLTAVLGKTLKAFGVELPAIESKALRIALGAVGAALIAGVAASAYLPWAQTSPAIGLGSPPSSTTQKSGHASSAEAGAPVDPVAVAKMEAEVRAQIASLKGDIARIEAQMRRSDELVEELKMGPGAAKAVGEHAALRGEFVEAIEHRKELISANQRILQDLRDLKRPK